MQTISDHSLTGAEHELRLDKQVGHLHIFVIQIKVGADDN